MTRFEDKTHFTCEQVYNLWSSEPEIIKIIDLRSESEFAAGHIPGAVRIEPEDLALVLGNLGDKMAVIIASSEDEKKYIEAIKPFNNFVFLSQCQRWIALNYPVE